MVNQTSDADRLPTYGKKGAWAKWAALSAAVVLVGGCAVSPGTKSTQQQDETACGPAADAETWVGNWLGVNKRKGVAGELHVFMSLHQDGTMAYSEQLKRPGKSPQDLREIGCWHRQGQTLVLRTTHSNAVAVEHGDPIYTNEYETQTRTGELVLQGPEGPLSFRKMPDDYRPPVF